MRLWNCLVMKTRLHEVVLEMSTRISILSPTEERIYKVFRISTIYRKWTERFYAMEWHYRTQGVTGKELCKKLEKYDIRVAIIDWSLNVTPEQLEIEFNSHEVMELMLDAD